MRKRGSQLGSSSSTDPARALAGRLGRPVGLKGHLGLYVDPDDLVYFSPGSVVYVEGEPLVVRATRRGKRGHEVAFEEIVDRTGAEAIRNKDVFTGTRRSLDEGEFWRDQLVGLEVRPGGGRVVGVEHGPTQDRLVIERESARFEVPFVHELVPVVDLDAGFVEIQEIEGLNG